MTVFDLYSAYYDLLYLDKDYNAETSYLCERLDEASVVPAGTLLELGCGTGGHAVELARLGRAVHGVDLSDSMVARARRRAAADPLRRLELQFEVGDIRSHRAGRHYDAVFSLFHVISYQTTDDDLAAAFATARVHLEEGGAFVFDCWYGPAVLTDRPRHEIKQVTNERIAVERRTTPTVHVNANCVDIRFDIEVTARAGGDRRTFHEVHRMRYLFLPEIKVQLDAAGFEFVSAYRWMTRESPDDRSWYVCIAARAV